MQSFEEFPLKLFEESHIQTFMKRQLDEMTVQNQMSLQE